MEKWSLQTLFSIRAKRPQRRRARRNGCFRRLVYEPVERNFIFLACRKHKTRKIIFFNWLHFFFSWLFLYHKEVTRVFSSTLNFAWQFIGDAQFYRKLKCANFVERNSILTLSCRATRSCSLEVKLSSWRSARKVQLCFLRDLAFHLQNCRIQ